MTIRLRFFLAFSIAGILAFFLLAKWLRDDVKNRYFQILEDSLSETANLLASVAETHAMPGGRINFHGLREALDSALKRKLNADIFGQKKQDIELRIYATDALGIVVYDSAKFGLGSDYSRWNDVYLTLQGRYGARSSKDDPRYPQVSVKYVAAPIRGHGKVAGVLTAAKPAITLEQAIAATKEKILFSLSIVFTAFMGIAIGITFWITRPIAKLTQYVQAIRAGKHAASPSLGSSEIGNLGREFEMMRAEIDGKTYIENFTTLMTHEFKSPLAGILGAAEILEGDVEKLDKQKFVGNIVREAQRMNQITENLLQIAKLENLRVLEHQEWIHLAELIEALREDLSPELLRGNIVWLTEVSEHLMIRGNYFYLYQAIRNLAENAIDFSPDHGEIRFRGYQDNRKIVLEITDTGAGIPEFALGKIFDKFFSLERPIKHRKGTGLGLAFVKQVVELHAGQIQISNRAESGVVVHLEFPDR